ncbi:hypothetical protein Tco_0167954 [Tanacetum coccineum]
MAESNNYITATRKNFVSDDNEGRMVEKCIIEIQGTFLVKIREDAFNGNDGENTYEHINKLLKIVGPIKINGLTQDRSRLSIFPVSLAGAAYEWFTKECIGSITTWDNMLEKFILKFHYLSDHNEEETEEDDNPNEMDNVPEFFRIKRNLFDFETPLCEAYHEFSCLLKIDTDLFTYDIQNFKTYDEYKQELKGDKAKGTEKPWSENGVPYQLCDHICEPYRFKNGGTKWPTCTSDIDGRGPYANMKTEWVSNPYLDTNRIFGRDYEASNVSCTQENQKDDTIPKPSNCKVRRFEMMKYSFNYDEEYITIKESEYLNHSNDSIDAYQELLRLIDDGWVVTIPDDE